MSIPFSYELWRKLHGRPHLLLVAAVALTLILAELRAESIDILQRLKSEAIPEWRAMEQKLAHSQFEYKITETSDTSQPTMRRVKRVSGQRLGDSFLINETIESTDQISVYGRNDRYEFALNRTGSAPWMIDWQSSQFGPDTPVGSANAYFSGMLQLPWSISATSLEKLVCDPRFSIHSARTANDGTVHLTFAVAPAEAAVDGLQGISNGTLIVDPAQHWAVTRYDVQYKSKGSSGVRISYGPAGPPDIRHLEFVLNLSPSKSSKFVIDSTTFDWNPSQQADITLTAFGLPDYQDANNTTQRLVLINVGLICVVVGLMLYLRRRHAVG